MAVEMRSAIANRMVILAALLLVGGCASSPPVRFFALSVEPASTDAKRASKAHVQITAVHIPGVLDRQQMVCGSGAELTVSDQHRWAAPLAEMIQRVLTQDLAARSPGGMVVLPQEPAPVGTAQIVIDILQFGCD